MKQKKIAIIMAGILAAAAAMTGCAEQNKTETQVDYTQNSQEKSEQTKQKTAEKSQPDKKQVNKSTSIGKEDSNQTADKERKYLLHPIMQATYRIQRMEQTVLQIILQELIQTIPRPQGWTLLHLKTMAQQATAAIKLIRQQIRR